MTTVDHVKTDRKQEISTFWRPPFSTASPTAMKFDPSMTVEAMVDEMDFLPPDFAGRGRLILNGRGQEFELDRTQWHRIRLKPGQRLTCHYPLRDGGREGGGSKAVLAVVLAVATVLTAGAITAFGVPFIGVAAGTWQAAVIAAPISTTGSSIVGVLAP
jgi:hypothetical protein